MMLTVFFDFYAVAAYLLIAGISWLVFRREATSAAGINGMAEFSFYLSLCVAVVRIIYTLLIIHDTALLGGPLSFCLLLLLYAAVVRLFVMLVVRVKNGIRS